MIEQASPADAEDSKLTAIFNAIVANIPNWILGIWLLAIYCLLLTYTVFAFGAYQMHVALNSANESGGTLSMDELRGQNAERAALRSQINELYFDADREYSKRLAKVKIKSDYELERSNIFMDCREQIRTRKQAIDKNYAGSAEFCEEGNPANGGDGVIANVIVKSVALVKDINNGIFVVDNDIKDIQSDIDRIEAETKVRLDEQTTITRGWTQQAKALISKIEYFEVAGHDGMTAYILPDFVGMSEDVLALVIVLAMGAIGGALHITRNFLAPENADNVDTYLVRYRYMFLQPFLGAFTAFAIYIFVRAGVIVMSSSSGGNTSMSPFFIAFLGITSGFLANVALDVIEGTGKTLFRAQTDKERARWAYGLKSALIEAAKAKTGQADVSQDELAREIEIMARTIQVDARKLLAWIDLKEMVPSSFQRFISIYMKMHPRLIFTDVPENDEAGAV